MHELGIVFHIIRTVEDVAKENHVARIQRVTLQLGEVSGVVESYLQDCWKWAAAKSEILPGAALTVEQIPAITLCEDCGQQYPTVPHGRTCPHCQSPHTHLLQGNEMMIKEVEAVQPGDAPRQKQTRRGRQLLCCAAPAGAAIYGVQSIRYRNPASARR